MNRFVAGPDFYNYDMYGGLRSGGGVQFFSRSFVGLVAATFTSSKLQLSESQTEAMDRLVEVPAALAFFVGLYADAVPVWGSRRKSYMVLGMGFSLLCLTLIGLGCLFAGDIEDAIGSSFSYFMMMLMGGVSFGSMINFCSVHTGGRGAVPTGKLREKRLLIFLIQNVIATFEISFLLLVLMPLSVTTIVVVLGGLNEVPVYRKESLRCKCESYWKLTKQKAVWRVLVVVASFAFFLNFGFPLVTDTLRTWTDTTDNASALLTNGLNDVVMIVTVLMWRWRFRNVLWKRFFAMAPTMTIIPQVILAVLVIPALYRGSVIYIALTGVAGVSSGVMALVLLVPVTEIIEEGTEGGVRASSFPSRDDQDTTHYRWSIAILEVVTCCVNSMAYITLTILPLQKLDAQLVRMYGGFTDNAGALTAAAFLTSLAYCVAYNIYIFSEAIN
ncbi:hypothetical protein PRIC2_014433 [Phytophthora ramorum]